MFGGLKKKISSVDLDSLLSYDTIKVVHVRDRRLGGLYWFFNIAILIYILYTVIKDQKYNSKEPPVPGSVRISLKAPNGTLQTPSYCQNGRGCVYLSPDQIIFPQGNDREVFITTRISQRNYTAPPNCNVLLPTSAGCVYTAGEFQDSGNYFVADIENYTMMIEHSVRGGLTDIAKRSGLLKGSLVRHDAREDTPPAFKVFHNETSPPNIDGDVMTVAELLEASGLNLEDPSFAPGANKAAGETQRSAGAVIVVLIDYRNRMASLNQIKYYYRPALIDGAEYKTLEVRGNPDGSVTELNRHGIKIVFQQSGVIGQFDFLVLLTNLVASVALLKVASVIVEVLMLRILPERQQYSQIKFEDTDDFDQMRKDRKRASRNDLPLSERNV